MRLEDFRFKLTKDGETFKAGFDDLQGYEGEDCGIFISYASKTAPKSLIGEKVIDNSGWGLNGVVDGWEIEVDLEEIQKAQEETIKEMELTIKELREANESFNGTEFEVIRLKEQNKKLQKEYDKTWRENSMYREKLARREENLIRIIKIALREFINESIMSVKAKDPEPYR